MNESAVKTLILARLRAKQARERCQVDLIRDDSIFAETVRAKLDGLWDASQFWNFSRCGLEDFYRTCKECGTVETYKYRCSIKWCPRCSWILADRRRKIIKKWAARISQPKHLILTQRNFAILTGAKIREHQKNLVRFRRSECFQEVRGGCTSIEITNEEKGWHLHSHSLLDVRWLDMQAVAQTWGRIVGQEFAIVKIKDVRSTDYLQELTKYVVEGSELAKWPAEHILEFVLAVKGKRFFFAFGSMFQLGAEIRRELKAEKGETPTCDCGSQEFRYEDEATSVLNEIRRMSRRR